jgi:hypothetical protein
MKDLVVLVADKNTQFALKGAFGRPEALGIRPIEFEFRVHSGRDGGARKTGPEMLALERRRFRHALLVFDFEGCGTELENAKAVEAKLDERLSVHWKAAAKSIVIEPELDVWVWEGTTQSKRRSIGPVARGCANCRTWQANASEGGVGRRHEKIRVAKVLRPLSSDRQANQPAAMRR